MKPLSGSIHRNTIWGTGYEKLDCVYVPKTVCSVGMPACVSEWEGNRLTNWLCMCWLLSYLISLMQISNLDEHCPQIGNMGLLIFPTWTLVKGKASTSTITAFFSSDSFITTFLISPLFPLLSFFHYRHSYGFFFMLSFFAQIFLSLSSSFQLFISLPVYSLVNF